VKLVASNNLGAGVQSHQTHSQRLEVERTLLLKAVDPGAEVLVLVHMREAHGTQQLEQLVQGARRNLVLLRESTVLPKNKSPLH
jgi:hypothetical protein